MSDEERWAQQKEWDNEPQEIPECCEEEHPDGDLDAKCDCTCHWTKEDWAADKADRDYHDKEAA